MLGRPDLPLHHRSLCPCPLPTPLPNLLPPYLQKAHHAGSSPGPTRNFVVSELAISHHSSRSIFTLGCPVLLPSSPSCTLYLMISEHRGATLAGLRITFTTVSCLGHYSPEYKNNYEKKRQSLMSSQIARSRLARKCAHSFSASAVAALGKKRKRSSTQTIKIRRRFRQ